MDSGTSHTMSARISHNGWSEISQRRDSDQKKLCICYLKMLHGCEGLSIFKKHSEELFRQDLFVLNNERNFSLSVAIRIVDEQITCEN